MAKSFRRPRTDVELKELEAAGLWQAQALAKQIGESHQKITVNTILNIHKVFFQHVNTDIAGRFRKPGEDIKKLTYITPPPGIAVQMKMYEFWRELDTKLARVPTLPKIGSKNSLRKAQAIRNEIVNEIVTDLAAWVQYKIVFIHPFVEGNGRMARLMTNLILYRHGFQPTDIKYEGENKKNYLEALGAIDLRNDFRPLRQLIIKGIIASYQKLVSVQKKNQKQLLK